MSEMRGNLEPSGRQHIKWNISFMGEGLEWLILTAHLSTLSVAKYIHFGVFPPLKVNCQ